MPRTLDDRTADKFLILAFLLWGVAIASPAVGMMAQFVVIAVLAWKCDIKTIPALLVLMLGRGNLRTSMTTIALRFGITFTPSSFLLIVAFFFMMRELLSGRYDRPTSFFAVFWLLSVIPAAWMSMEAKSMNLVGVWSGPIMDWVGPAIYFWAVSMGRTYEAGRHYLVTRLLFLMMFWNFFSLVPVVYTFTFIHTGLLACLGLYVLKSDEYRDWRFLGLCALMLSLATIVFARANVMAMGDVELVAGDKHGDSFSTMAIYAGAISMSYAFSRGKLLGLGSLIPILMVCANVLLVSYVITTQASNKAHDVTFRYQSLQERLEWKLYGDRAFVWRMGWEDAKTPPYIIRDMRNFFYVDENGKIGIKIPPHNQYLTFLSRRGFWLGIVLSLFIIWVQIRGFRVMAKCSEDKFITMVSIPVGAAIFGVIGTTGQSCLGNDLWGNGLATSVFPGIVYGHWVWMRKMRNRFRNPFPAVAYR